MPKVQLDENNNLKIEFEDGSFREANSPECHLMLAIIQKLDAIELSLRMLPLTLGTRGPSKEERINGSQSS